MILVDTSVWIDHLRGGDAHLAQLLQRNLVFGHSLVTGEIALGSLRNRRDVLDALHNLPQATMATDAEVFEAIERDALFGMGIGFVDAHLLCSVSLSPRYSRQGTQFWTRDKRLAGLAHTLNFAYQPTTN